MSDVPESLPAVAAENDLITCMAETHLMPRDQFWKMLRGTVIPETATDYDVLTYLAVAKELELSPINREIYAFKAQGGAIVPVVGIDGWLKRMRAIPGFDGIETDTIGKPTDVEAVTCRLFIKHISRPFECTEWMHECRRPTGPWKQNPNRMLRHRAIIQTVRLAAGLGGARDADEVEFFDAEATVVGPTDLGGRLEALEGEIEKGQTEEPDAPPPAPEQVQEDPPAPPAAVGTQVEFARVPGHSCERDACFARLLVRCSGCDALVCKEHFNETEGVCWECVDAERNPAGSDGERFTPSEDSDAPRPESPAEPAGAPEEKNEGSLNDRLNDPNYPKNAGEYRKCPMCGKSGPNVEFDHQKGICTECIPKLERDATVPPAAESIPSPGQLPF